MIHPPVGLNLFVLSTISNAAIGEAIKEILAVVDHALAQLRFWLRGGARRRALTRHGRAMTLIIAGEFVIGVGCSALTIVLIASPP
ncbi:hypothetical protein [Bradyrhizobium campsiandrae]|uniref:hypothetical protein n=1 Tax=Bradyrhizobium campsiandrae TaxID=1729892 RepID=UPI0035E089F6